MSKPIIDFDGGSMIQRDAYDDIRHELAVDEFGLFFIAFIVRRKTDDAIDAMNPYEPKNIVYRKWKLEEVVCPRWWSYV